MSLKKSTNLALAVVLCLLLCTVTASADEGKTYTEGTLRYTFDGSTITITGYFGADEEVTIPSVIAGYAVSEIASGAFADTAARIVHVPSSVVTMHEDTFSPGVTVILQIDGRPETVTDAQSEDTPGTAPETDTAAAADTEGTGTPAESGTEPAGRDTAADTAADTGKAPGNGSRSGCASAVTAWVFPAVAAAVLFSARRKAEGR